MVTDTELFEIMRSELFTAVVGDVMDKMGLLHQFLPPYLTVLDRDMVIVGRARTVLLMDVHAERIQDSANSLMAKPFGLTFEALDSLTTNDVYICTGASPTFALWGGLMSTRALHLGAAGAILDGCVRDSREILSLGLPVVSRGCYAQDSGPRGKVVDYDVPLVIGQARIESGDVLFADCDGTLVIPQAVAQEVIAAALEKVRGEDAVREALKSGMSTVEAFDRFGIM